jgi:predicted RNase H-like HicB family nuclease
MKTYLLKVEVEPLEDGRYLAACPDLEGCHAEGDTIAEALENVEDVARVIIELCIEKGLPLPPELRGAQKLPVVKAEVVVRIGS